MDLQPTPGEGQSRTLNILYAAAEAFPFVKVGGLADVAGALPKHLARLGHNVWLMVPRYAPVDARTFDLRGPLVTLPIATGERVESADIYESASLPGVRALFVSNGRYFGRRAVYGYGDDDARFVFFSKSVVRALEKLEWRPDIVHCNDWHTALVPDYIAAASPNGFFEGTATVLTIHNLAYQGPFTGRTLRLVGVGSQDPSLNVMARGIIAADMVNTVSRTYAAEITTPAGGMNMDGLLRARGDRFCGILNGVDYEEFDPATDRHIARRYGADSLPDRAANKRALQERSGFPRDPGAPLLGMVCRLDHQKGLDLVAAVIDHLVAFDVQLVVMGVGASQYARLLRRRARAYPRQVAYHPTADESLARRVYAGSDVLLSPSTFEPCGLGPIIALRYGAIPVVRKTGGLADTIPDYTDDPRRGLGFTFTGRTPSSLLAAIRRALAVYRDAPSWRSLITRAMAADYSWDQSAREYERLYHRALAVRRSAPTGRSR